MRQLRKMLFVVWILLCPAGSAWAEVNVSIGINIPIFPQLVVVPGYPVYYAPQLPVNYFFYDGLYWVFEDDNWYASSWYNGPWWVVEPDYVPLFILRIPVRYYRDPPPYFRGWHSHAPPHWGRHWGPSWESRRRGWDHWQRSAVPPRAPLPVYQRRYYGERYPRVEAQRELRSRHYKYEPRTRVVREIYREERRGRDGERGDRIYRGGPRERDGQRPDGSQRRSEPRSYQRGEQQDRLQGPRDGRSEGQVQKPRERREYRDPGQGRGSEGKGGGQGEVRGGGRSESRGGGHGGGPPEGRGGGQGVQGGGRGGGGKD